MQLKEYGINNSNDLFPYYNSIENWVSNVKKFPLLAVYIRYSWDDFVKFIYTCSDVGF